MKPSRTKTTRTHDDDAERSVIAAALLSDIAGELVELLAPADFFDPRHQAMWEAIGDIVADDMQPDEVSLMDRLNTAERGVAGAGGLAYVLEVIGHSATTANAHSHAAIIRRHAKARAAGLAAATIAEAVAKPHATEEAMREAIAPHVAALKEATTEPRAKQPPAPFPVDALPGHVATMVRAVAENVQVAPTMPALCALAAVSATLGRTVAHDPVRDKRARANLFLVGVAESGCGKSETIRHFLSPLLEIEQHLADKWRERACEWKAEIKRIEQDNGKKTGVYSAKSELELEELNKRLAAGSPVLVGEDMTVEKLEAMLAANDGKLLVATAEGHRLFQNISGRNNQNNADDSGTWCKVWSGDRINTRRMQREVVVENPAVVMLALVQPDLAAKFRGNDEFATRGLLARTLFADTFAKPAPVCPEKGVQRVNPRTTEAWNRLLSELYPVCNDTRFQRELTFSRGAARIIAAIHNEQVAAFCAGKMDRFAVAARRAEQASRIAVVLHAMTHSADLFSHNISESTMHAAAEIELFFRQFQEVSRNEDSRAARVIDRMRSTGGQANATEIRRAAGLSSSAKARDLIQNLLETGKIKLVSVNGKESYRLAS